MKKVLALFLSLTMLVTMLAGMEISVRAEEEEWTTLGIGSEVLGADDEDEFMYSVEVNGEPYEAFAYDLDEEEHYFYGLVKIPAPQIYTFEIPIGAEYSIYRLEFSKDGYEKIPAAERTGTIDKYFYSESYVLDDEFVFNNLTKDEYNEKTDNGKNTKQFFYYEPNSKDIKQADELITGSLYTESVTDETEIELAYLDGTQTETPVSVDVTAEYNVRKPITSVGRTTYYYTGTITLTVDEKIYEQDYATVPATDSQTAKTNAITTITPIIRTYAAQGLSELKGEKQTAFYYENSIEAMLPNASDLTTTEQEKQKIVSSTTKIIEIPTPYQKVNVSYDMEEKEFGDLVLFDGTLITIHQHDFQKAEIVDPTCLEDGYTVYTCSVENCNETEKRDIVEKNEKYHGWQKPVGNGDGVAATCTEPGKTQSTSQTCLYCGEKKTVEESTVIEARGHLSSNRVVEENKVNPTCEQDGSYDEVVHCLRCNAEISRETKVIPKTGHNWDNGVVTKNATCGVAGVKTFTCKTCKKTKTEPIKATGYHNNTKSVTKAPTSTNAGVMTYKCKVCGKKTTESIKKLDKASISKLAAKSKGFTASWKKVSSATGYQLQYSPSSKFTKSTTSTLLITKNSTVSKTISNKQAKKKYYVRIRTYRTINGTKYYSSWSKAKTITTKK